MKHLYGEFTKEQIVQTKISLRGSIFFLLVCVDKNTRDEYTDVDIEQYFTNLLYKISGLNDVLMNQPELVTVISLLQSARNEYLNPNFKFKNYRKLILDAGAEILKLREED